MYKSDGNIIIIADANAHFDMVMGPRVCGKTTHSGSVLSKFMHRSSLYCVDLSSICTGHRYTFKSSLGNRSYIDHCLVYVKSSQYVSQCFVREKTY